MKATWDRILDRIADLTGSLPAAARILEFYGELAAYQKEIALQSWKILEECKARSPYELYAVAPFVVMRFRDEFERILGDHASPEAGLVVPTQEFLITASLQPILHVMAPEGVQEAAPARPGSCPFCGEKPVVGALREAGDADERSMVCSVCLTEWRVPRVACLACGESDPEKLPRYTAEQIPHVHVEACDACGKYVKVVDLTREGGAVPVVDDLATPALDVAARERGYVRLMPNLAGL